MKDHRKKLLESVGIAVVAWLPFFVWQLGYQMKGAEQPDTVKVPAPPPAQITIVRVNPPMKEQCWMQNITIPPIPPFLSSNETVMFCNQEVKAPFVVILDYDDKLAAGTGFQFGGRRTKSGMEAVFDTKYEAKFDAPTLAPFEMFIATVQGNTAKAPSAIKTYIKHIDPDKR